MTKDDDATWNNADWREQMSLPPLPKDAWRRDDTLPKPPAEEGYNWVRGKNGRWSQEKNYLDNPDRPEDSMFNNDEWRKKIGLPLRRSNSDVGSEAQSAAVPSASPAAPTDSSAPAEPAPTDASAAPAKALAKMPTRPGQHPIVTPAMIKAAGAVDLREYLNMQKGLIDRRAASVVNKKAGIPPEDFSPQKLYPKVGPPKKYAKGGKISLDACGVSTHKPAKKNANW